MVAPGAACSRSVIIIVFIVVALTVASILVIVLVDGAPLFDRSGDGRPRVSGLPEQPFPGLLGLLLEPPGGSVLLTVYDFPAAHWQTIRSTHVIELAFATLKLRQRITKGAGTRTRRLTMAFKLLEMVEKRWRRIRSPKLVQEILGATKFLDERSDQGQNPEERAA